MAKGRSGAEAKRKPAKRMLAAGRKIDGVWTVRTFLRSLTGEEPVHFWETSRRRVG